MRVLPYFSLFLFVGGLTLLLAGFATARHDAESTAPAAAFDFRFTQVSLQSPAFTATLAAEASPTPTVTPFSGPVARMKIPSIDVDSPIEEIGITNNQLDTPSDAVRSIGWYSIYDRPGHDGNAVFAAHKNYDFQEGPFSRLDSLRPHDEIVVEMEAGPAYVYEVAFYQRYGVDAIPMGELIDAPRRPPGAEWITLITCGGRFQATEENGLGHYLERDVVIASRIR
ncbi:MAG: class F sortase [Tepidiformaceae bacterium]